MRLLLHSPERNYSVRNLSDRGSMTCSVKRYRKRKSQRSTITFWKASKRTPREKNPRLVGHDLLSHVVIVDTAGQKPVLCRTGLLAQCKYCTLPREECGPLKKQQQWWNLDSNKGKQSFNAAEAFANLWLGRAGSWDWAVTSLKMCSLWCKNENWSINIRKDGVEMEKEDHLLKSCVTSHIRAGEQGKPLPEWPM